MKTITFEQLAEQGEELFGKDKKEWRFRCISCGECQTYNEFKAAGVEDPSGLVHFSCIGRYVEGRGCNWTLGGLFTIHEKEVGRDGKMHPVFNFDGEPYSEEREQALSKKQTAAFKKI